MSDGLISVGVDVGTTTTQLIVSRLQIRNQAGAFAVPEMVITQRDILYQSPVHFTPLLDESHVNGAAIREIVAAEYEKAGLGKDHYHRLCARVKAPSGYACLLGFKSGADQYDAIFVPAAG